MLGCLAGLTCPYNQCMTIGEQLLELADEYRASKEARSFGMGKPAGREPKDIAADYETALRQLLSA